MQLTGAQESVVLTLFKEADTDGQGRIPANLLSGLLRRITGKAPLAVQVKELLVDENGQELTELTLDDFHSKLGQYLSDRRVADWGCLTTPLSGPVGIDSVSSQVQKRALKQGFELNIMVVGQSGLGKSTMTNTIFKSLLARTPRHTSTADIPQTVEVESVTHVLEEKGARVKLTITDTPGFGDQMNNTGAWEPIVEYIKAQYKTYLAEESNPRRKRYIPDTRVHAVLYFIAPTGHSLRALDVASIKSFSQIANVIPIIAKSDTLTPEEREGFKRRIMEDVEAHQIKLYPFVTEDHDEEDVQEVNEWRSKMPFCVIGCDDFSEAQLVRRTKWGTINVDNPAHCDLPLLRDLLIRTHLADLITTTDKIFYEEYRSQNYNPIPLK
eukprot:comp11398_c0_seq1/m.5774 comp11398_c0_seq1/g.5774  ORF comp11398_c0_seq1/g.5774 comp11398_c0_seq1/m.5774 type:complete len:383 (-) comp11398_c0_seq1:617-1765(-)